MDASVEDISTIGRDADVIEDTAPRERHPEPLPVGGSLGVAVQGNWVMGPGDYQPLAVVGTSRPAGRSKEHKMRKLITAMAIGGALAAGGIVVAGPASADGPCGGAVVLGNGGGRCDSTDARMAASPAATLCTCSVSAARTAIWCTPHHRQTLRRQRKDRHSAGSLAQVLVHVRRPPHQCAERHADHDHCREWQCDLKRSRGRDCRYKSNFSLTCLVRKCSRMTPSSGIVPASSVPIVVQTGQLTLNARLSVASRYRLVHLSCTMRRP